MASWLVWWGAIFYLVCAGACVQVFWYFEHLQEAVQGGSFVQGGTGGFLGVRELEAALVRSESHVGHAPDNRKSQTLPGSLE